MKAFHVSLLAPLALLVSHGWSQEPAAPAGADLPPVELPDVTEPPPNLEPAPPAGEALKEKAPTGEKESLPAARDAAGAGAKDSASAAEPASSPGRKFWECQLPSGSFTVGLPDVVTVSYHEYVVDGQAAMFETTIATRSPVVARFYYRKPLLAKSVAPARSPLEEGRRALERAQSLFATGRHLGGVVPDHGLPVKRADDLALAPTVEYRFGRQADVLALYQSALSAWKNDRGGLFRLAEE